MCYNQLNRTAKEDKLVKEERLKREDVNFSFLSKDPRFENLTDQVFGELKILGPYKKEGNTLKWVAECSCGNIIKTSRTKLKHRGKTSCVDCAEQRLRDKHFTPMDKKLSDLEGVREDLLIHGFLGLTWADDWDVTCKTCDTRYQRKYRDLIKGVKGCGCANYARKDLDSKQQHVIKYCEEHGFEFLGWNLENRIKIDIYCPTHDHNMSPYYGNVEKGRISCKYCKKEKYKPYNLKTQEKFVEESKQLHGDKYDYSLVEYVNSDTHVKIKCNNCGTVNEQTPAGHLSGRNCKVCAKTGYKPNEPCWVYIMKLEGLCEEWYKIGITNSLKTRLYNVGLGSWYDITYLDFKLLDKGYKARRIEQHILNQLETAGSIDSRYHKEGNTEIFKPCELSFVESELEDLYIKEIL